MCCGDRGLYFIYCCSRCVVCVVIGPERRQLFLPKRAIRITLIRIFLSWGTVTGAPPSASSWTSPPHALRRSRPSRLLRPLWLRASLACGWQAPRVHLRRRLGKVSPLLGVWGFCPGSGGRPRGSACPVFFSGGVGFRRFFSGPHHPSVGGHGGLFHGHPGPGRPSDQSTFVRSRRALRRLVRDAARGSPSGFSLWQVWRPTLTKVWGPSRFGGGWFRRLSRFRNQDRGGHRTAQRKHLAALHRESGEGWALPLRPPQSGDQDMWGGHCQGRPGTVL